MSESSRDIITSAFSSPDGFASGQPTLVGLPIDYRENLLLTERLGMIDETL